ncbi:site-specific integrase [Xanthobacter autotrophicus]|uniref:site-specific integrase n=1 Tax=Xanthobacter autotrophicus TaxID=280 RepID=UPI003726A644
MNRPAPLATVLAAPALPACVIAAGVTGQTRFIEFFTAHIRNPNTRRAYARDVRAFLDWCTLNGINSLAAISPVHVGTYVEMLSRELAVPTGT